MENLSVIKKIKVAIKSKEDIEEFSEKFKKIIEIDEREMRYETKELLRYLRMKKITKIDEIKIAKIERKISKNVANEIEHFITEKAIALKKHLIFIIRFPKPAK